MLLLVTQSLYLFSLQNKLLYTNYYDYIACLTELCLLDREKGFGSLAEPIGFWMLVGW